MTDDTGFRVQKTKKAGLFGRMMGRKAPENAFIEIRNELATNGIEALTRSTVEALLTEHGWKQPDAQPGLMRIYQDALRPRLADRALSAEEVGVMTTLQAAVGLTDDVAAQCKVEVAGDLYREAFTEMMKDRRVYREEKDDLLKLGRETKVPDHRSWELGEV